MSDHEVKMIILSTDDLDESIRFYSETLGMSLKFRDGAHFAALDGGPITLALATAVDHPIPGQVVVGIKTADVDAAAKAIEASGGGIVKGPYDDAHERRAVVYDNKGNGVVFYNRFGPMNDTRASAREQPKRWTCSSRRYTKSLRRLGISRQTSRAGLSAIWWLTPRAPRRRS